MTKPRKPRSDSTAAKVLHFQRRQPETPSGIVLRGQDRPYWRAGMSCRDDWNEIELCSLAQFARAMADHDKLTEEIATEGIVVDGKPNLKIAVAEMLIRRALSLARHLQIHARAVRGEARDVAKRDRAPIIDDDDSLIAGPEN